MEENVMDGLWYLMPLSNVMEECVIRWWNEKSVSQEKNQSEFPIVETYGWMYGLCKEPYFQIRLNAKSQTV